MPASYSAGTIAVSAAGTTVTGTGTLFVAGGIREGDVFWCAGLSVSVLSVNSNTSLTLAFPWPGAAQSGAAYEVRFTSDAARVMSSTHDLIEELQNGNLGALASLVSAANKLPYFNGAGSAALADLTAFGRSLINKTGANGQYIAATGTGASAVRDIVGTTTQSSGTPTGALFQIGANANGRFLRLPGGFMACWHTLTLAAGSSAFLTADWTYPSAFNGAPIVLPATADTSSATPLENHLAGIRASAIGTVAATIRLPRITGQTDFGPSDTATASVIALGNWH